MAIRLYRPYTAGTRNRSVSDFQRLHLIHQKNFTCKKISGGGRNNRGIITTRHKGGGHKQRYRIIDFKRNKKTLKLSLLQLNMIPIEMLELL